MLLPQWQAKSDSEKAEVKMTNSAGDEIVEYAVHYAQMAPTHQTSQRRRRELVQNCCIDCYHY